MFEKIAEFIGDQLSVSVDEITMDTDIMDEFGADSLDMMEMIMAIEEEYGVEVDMENVENIKTIGDVIEYLNAQGIN